LKTLKTFGKVNRAAKTGNKEAQTEKRFRPIKRFWLNRQE
jgi:hypothetical protein